MNFTSNLLTTSEQHSNFKLWAGSINITNEQKKHLTVYVTLQ